MKRLILIILLLSAFIAGCTSEAAIEAPAPAPREATGAENPLSGTCIQGRSCTAPSCGQYIDADKDGACDRGIANQ